jgi:hypothetical protein
LKKQPVALLIFNRPKNTAHVFRAIRAYKPETLLVVADGPRPDRPDDMTLCAETRAVVENGVDWPCNLKLCYSDSNLGCGIRVSSGLDWVFSEFEEAIILEDDTVPDPTFFQFCGELIDRYRSDPQIFAICGDSIIHTRMRSNHSYRFSNFFSPWGWATWRNRWAQYDYKMNFWANLRTSCYLYDIMPQAHLKEMWTHIMDLTMDGKIDTWDYQWISTIWAHHAFVVHPARNLITNIGAGRNASHTFSFGNPRTYRKTYPADNPLRHPHVIQTDPYKELLIGSAFMKTPSFFMKLISVARSMFFRYTM